jgi:hypothetical protein
VRIAMTWGGILMTLDTHAAQGLFEAFAAARAKIALVPREIPPPAQGSRRGLRPPDIGDRLDPAHLRGHRRIGHEQGGRQDGALVNLHTGPITWQIRDHVGLRSAMELLTSAHKTAIAPHWA